MALVGYARVSSSGQKLDVQINKLKKHGCTKLFQDKISGVDQNRPELKECLNYLREGDTLIITKLDRLARSVTHLNTIVDDLKTQNISFFVLDQNIDTSSSSGKLLFQILSSLAEFENNIRKERQMDGIIQAKKKGIKFGRKKIISEDIINNIKRDRKNGISVIKIASTYKIDRSYIYRLIKMK